MREDLGRGIDFQFFYQRLDVDAAVLVVNAVGFVGLVTTDVWPAVW